MRSESEAKGDTLVPVKLTDEQVREVREKFAAGARQIDLAAEYGISQNTVSSLVLGRTRRSAGGKLSPGTAQKLTVDDVRRIRDDLAAGLSREVLAQNFGVSHQMISHIAAGRAFADVTGPLVGASRAVSPPLTSDQVEDILDRVHDGQDRQLVAEAFAVSLSTVNAVMTGRIAGKGADEGRRFSREQIRSIRTEFRDGARQGDLAKQYSTEQQTISRIVLGLMYPSYGGPLASPATRRLSRQQVEAMRIAYAATATIAELAQRHGLDPSQVVSVLTGATYATYPGPLVDPRDL